jgi:hypothetical protein
MKLLEPLHQLLMRRFWGRAAILALAVAAGWATDRFYTGVAVASILFVSVFVGTNLAAAGIHWSETRRNAAG